MSDDQSPNGAILQQQVTPEKDINSSIMNKVKSRVSSIFPNKLTKWFSPSATSNENKNNGALRRRRDSSEDDENNREEDQEIEEHIHENIVNKKLTNVRKVSAVLPPPNKKQKSDLNEELTPVVMKQNNILLSNKPKYNNYQTSTPPTLMPYRRNFVRNINKNSTPYAFTIDNMQFNNNLNEKNKVVNDEVLSGGNDEVGENVKLDDTDDDNDCIDNIEMPKQKKITSRKSIRENSMENSLSERRTLNINSNYDRNLPSTSKSMIGSNFDNNDNLIKTNNTNMNHNNENNDEDDDVENEINAVVNNEVVLNNDTGSENSESTSGCSSMQAPTNTHIINQNNSYLRPQSSAGRINSNTDLLKNDNQINDDNRRVSGLFGNKKRLRTFGPGLLNTSGQNTPTGSSVNSNVAINFSTHLQTDKSLFSNKNLVKNSLNNSTTSLNSLANRRQSFNASLYSSTSALSDGKLFSTSSPFYSGKTMYGGASAYPSNKRLNVQPSHQQNTLRIPIQIRPSSSLSSNTSLGTNNINNGNNDTTTSLSNTAKRILELMNQFTTPLQEAKKMASTSSLRFQSKDRSQNKINRITSPRLTPYNRPNNNSNMKTNCPNTTELEVPTMSQLLQMRKLLNTEKVRKLADNSSSILNKKEEYKLPANNDVDITSGSNNNNNISAGKHVNKIKNKINTIRASSKDINEELSNFAVVSLPNISLPLMKSVPKFDISIPQSISIPALIPAKTLATTFNTIKDSNCFNNKNNNTFKFSPPLCVNGKIENQGIIPLNHYKFSKPLDILNSINNVVTPEVKMPSPPALKSGSCLDVFKSSTTSTDNGFAKATTTTTTNIGFGNQFKVASDKWECDVCMIRNDTSVNKCVACETPKPGGTGNKGPIELPKALPQQPLLGTIKNSFGDKFKSNSAATWECDTCMIVNKNDVSKCVACETPKPGSKVVTQQTNSLVGGIILPTTTTFKFGFQPISAPSEVTAPKPVESVQIFGAQQNSKWECTACSAKIDSNRNKCTCCDQAKPGAKNENIPQFSFGSSADKAPKGFSSIETTSDYSKIFSAKIDGIPKSDFVTYDSFNLNSKPNTSITDSKSSDFTANPIKAATALPTGFLFGGNNTVSNTDSLIKFGATTSNTTTVPLSTSISTTSILSPPKANEVTSTLFGSATASAVKSSFSGESKDLSSNAVQQVFGTTSFGGAKLMNSFLFGGPESKPKIETEIKKEIIAPTIGNATTNEFVFKSPSSVVTDSPLLTTSTTTVPNIKSNETVSAPRIGGFEYVTSVTGSQSDDVKTRISTDSTTIPKSSIGGFVFGSTSSVSLASGDMQTKSSDLNNDKSKTNILSFGSNVNNNNNPVATDLPLSPMGFSYSPAIGALKKPIENTQVLPLIASGNQSAIGSAPSPFTFGSTTKNNSAPPPPYEVIGFGQSSSGSALPTFGSFTANNTNNNKLKMNPDALQSVFGSSSSVVQPTTFGSGSSVNNQSNIFGALTNSPGFGNQTPQQTEKRGIRSVFGDPPIHENTSIGGAPKQSAGNQFGVFGSTAMGVAPSEQTTTEFSGKRSAPFEFNNYAPRPFAFAASNPNMNNNNQQSSDTNKQAFSFNATSAPSFNFSSAPQVQQQTQQPFTFGSQQTVSLPQQQQPIFNFGSTTNSTIETAQNASYQFDAINNPFAATSGGVNPNQQQQQGLNRRKIRGVRRVTPR